MMDQGKKECNHAFGFPYRGRVPCTGPRVCPACGMYLEDFEKEQGGVISDAKQECS